jgi:hypothetical protein
VWAAGASHAGGSGERFAHLGLPPTGNTVLVCTRTAAGDTQPAGTVYLVAACPN